MDPSQIAALVSEGSHLKATIKSQTERLKEIEATLLQSEHGELIGPDGTKALIVAPSPGIKPNSQDIDAVREIAGDNFTKLFDREVSHKPKKGFREIVAALFTPAKAQKIIGLCEKASVPYVKWT